jgi:hypothetical protein
MALVCLVGRVGLGMLRGMCLGMALMRLVRLVMLGGVCRMALVMGLVSGMVLVLGMREQRLVGNALGHGTWEHQGRLRLRHLLPRWRDAVPGHIEGVRHVWIRGAGGSIGKTAVERPGSEKMLRVCTLRLRRVALGLVGRRVVRGGRLLVRLVRVRRREAGVPPQVGLVEVEGGMSIGARGRQRHDAERSDGATT